MYLDVLRCCTSYLWCESILLQVISSLISGMSPFCNNYSLRKYCDFHSRVGQFFAVMVLFQELTSPNRGIQGRLGAI